AVTGHALLAGGTVHGEGRSLAPGDAGEVFHRLVLVARVQALLNRRDIEQGELHDTEGTGRPVERRVLVVDVPVRRDGDDELVLQFLVGDEVGRPGSVAGGRRRGNEKHHGEQRQAFHVSSARWAYFFLPWPE